MGDNRRVWTRLTPLVSVESERAFGKLTSVQERIEVDSSAVAAASQERRDHILRKSIESERNPEELSSPRGGNASREKDRPWLVTIDRMIPVTNQAWYLNLIEHTARLVHPTKPGHMPAELPPLLERLNLAAVRIAEATRHEPHVGSGRSQVYPL